MKPTRSNTKNEEEAKIEAVRYFKAMISSPTNNQYPGNATY